MARLKESMAEAKVYILRKEGQGTFGLGEEVALNCYLFRAGNYGLTHEELAQRIAAGNTKLSSVETEQ